MEDEETNETKPLDMEEADGDVVEPVTPQEDETEAEDEE